MKTDYSVVFSNIHFGVSSSRVGLKLIILRWVVAYPLLKIPTFLFRFEDITLTPLGLFSSGSTNVDYFPEVYKEKSESL